MVDDLHRAVQWIFSYSGNANRSRTNHYSQLLNKMTLKENMQTPAALSIVDSSFSVKQLETCWSFNFLLQKTDQHTIGHLKATRATLPPCAQPTATMLILAFILQWIDTYFFEHGERLHRDTTRFWVRFLKSLAMFTQQVLMCKSNFFH